MRLLLSFLFLSFLSSSLVAAPTSQVDEYLIKKLRKVYRNLAPSDPTRVNVRLRLADLLSEKARRDSLAEISKGCTTACYKGKKERKEALKHYLAGVKKINERRRGRIYTQIGHLYQELGQVERAKVFYKKIVSKESNSRILNGARFSLAEILFKQGRFAEALPLYTALSSQKKFPKRPTATYRKAWCMYHLGKYSSSVKVLLTMLKTPDLLRPFGGNVDGDVDASFQSAVAHDLATFYAKVPHNDFSAVETIYKYSPEGKKLKNLSYFAAELGRLGKRDLSIRAWKMVQNKQSDPSERFKTHFYLTELYLNSREKQKALESYRESLALWADAKEKCKGVECEQWEKRLKAFVVSWNQLEKSRPSEELVLAYRAYLEKFPKAGDVWVWLAQSVALQKNWKEGYKLFGFLYDSLKNKTFELDKTKKQVNTEFLLLQKIDMAEATKDKVFREMAYDFYLANSTAKTKHTDISYQKAYLMYEAAKYEEASKAFYALATKTLKNTKANRELKKKSAHLALDALVLLKKEEDIEKWSQEFAKALPKHRSEFLKIRRNSLFNRSATVSKGGDYKKSWDLLAQVNPRKLTVKERITYYKNKLVLAEKMKNINEVLKATDKLLKEKLSQEDKQFVYSRRAWAAEMVLDFKTSLKFIKELKTSKTFPEENKILKLALYANLAKLDPTKYYLEYLKKGKDKEKKKAMVVELLEKYQGAKKLAFLKKHRAMFKPEVYVTYYIETLAPKYPKWTRADTQYILKDPQLKDTFVGKLFVRQKFLKKFNTFKNKVASHKLNSKNERLLGRSITKRVKYLKQAEKQLKDAIELEDWTSQLLAVQLVQQEGERFYQDLISLPIPKGLSPEEQKQYLDLLGQQASEYRNLAMKYQNKFLEFWAQTEVMDKLKKGYANATKDLRKVYDYDLKMVFAVAPKDHAASFGEIFNTKAKELVKKAPKNLKEIESIKSSVIKNPFQISYLENLKEKEAEIGNNYMVSYLEKRIENLKETR